MKNNTIRPQQILHCPFHRPGIVVSVVHRNENNPMRHGILFLYTESVNFHVQINVQSQCRSRSPRISRMEQDGSVRIGWTAARIEGEGVSRMANACSSCNRTAGAGPLDQVCDRLRPLCAPQRTSLHDRTAPPTPVQQETLDLRHGIDTHHAVTIKFRITLSRHKS